MIEFKVTDNSDEILREFKEKADRAMEAVGLHGERRAKELCPVDTGRLRNSISHTTSGYLAIIGTNVEYAPYVEFGTSKQREQPYLRPAAQNYTSEYKAIFERYLFGEY